MSCLCRRKIKLLLIYDDIQMKFESVAVSRVDLSVTVGEVAWQTASGLKRMTLCSENKYC